MIHYKEYIVNENEFLTAQVEIKEFLRMHRR